MHIKCVFFKLYKVNRLPDQKLLKGSQINRFTLKRNIAQNPHRYNSFLNCCFSLTHQIVRVPNETNEYPPFAHIVQGPLRLSSISLLTLPDCPLEFITHEYTVPLVRPIKILLFAFFHQHRHRGIHLRCAHGKCVSSLFYVSPLYLDWLYSSS